MEDEATCAFCELPAETICRRCGRPYCGLHGSALCASCMDPSAGVPSARVFRFASIALGACILLGLWFLFGTPRAPGEAAHGGARAQHSAAQESGSGSPADTPTAVSSTTPTPAATAADTRAYTVQGGDTLASIAAAAGVPASQIQQLNPSIDPTNLQIGQTLRLPAKPP